MRIPVRNLWLLQLFASELYATDEGALAGAERLPEELPALVARILANEVTARLHTGLSVGFTRSLADLSRVRGRIDVLGTTRHMLLERGRVRCQFDEIVTDTPSNRLIRTALEKAAVLLPQDTRCRSLALQMEAAGVRGVGTSITSVANLYRQRLLARDRQMLAAAELLLTMSIPETGTGDFIVVTPDASDHRLRKLFENAVFCYYQHALTPAGWHVTHGEWLRWDWNEESMSAGIRAVFPGMQTDITLRAPVGDPDERRRRIVIDTKFAAITTAGHYRKNTLSSGYIYQMFAYLMSQNSRSEEHRHAEGLLLHPVVDGHFDEELSIQGHRIRFATVDLRASASEITRQLLSACSQNSAYGEFR